MTRPQYVDMYVNPNVTGPNDDLPNNQFWIVGNVGLKPFISDQFDLSLEYYFAEGSLLSVGFFMKDVKNFVSNTEYHADSSEIPFPLPDPVEAADGWTAYYEADSFQARVSYNYRSKYMLREVGAYGNRLHKAFGTVDLSASWFVTDQITVNFDVNNLFEQSAEQFGNNAQYSPNSGFTRGFPLYEYEAARRMTLGLSFKY